MKMIDIYEIVKVFEKYVQKQNEKVVITLHIKTETLKFKAYKQITYSLHYINRGTNNDIELVSMDNKGRVVNENDLTVLQNELNEKLILWMFDFIKERL